MSDSTKHTPFANHCNLSYCFFLDVGDSRQEWLKKRFYNVAWTSYHEKRYFSDLSSSLSESSFLARKEWTDSVSQSSN